MGVILTTEPSPGMILQVLDICFSSENRKYLKPPPSFFSAGLKPSQMNLQEIGDQQEIDRIKEKEKNRTKLEVFF